MPSKCESIIKVQRTNFSQQTFLNREMVEAFYYEEGTEEVCVVLKTGERMHLTDNIESAKLLIMPTSARFVGVVKEDHDPDVNFVPNENKIFVNCKFLVKMYQDEKNPCRVLEGVSGEIYKCSDSINELQSVMKS